LSTQTLTERIKDKAHQLGFTLVGVTNPEPPAHLDVYRHWIERGRHGEMGYLAIDRALQRRSDPRAILPECKSILVLGIPYANPASRLPPKDRNHGRIAAYAWGDDYHEVLKERLTALMEYIEQDFGQPVPNRWYTDSGPLLERELAQRAGLGWIGKNTMLINPEHGSYFLLAEILLGIELDEDAPITADRCGTCTRCLQACPTHCILPERILDATRCISYLTIELKGAVPTKLRSEMDDWVFGCDICQTACPWNERFAAEHGDPSLEPEAGRDRVNLADEIKFSPQGFNSKFKNSPVKRANRRGYLRNVAIALGNAKDLQSLPALVDALTTKKEPLVRGHAAWAIGQIGGVEVRSALEQARAQEKDDWVLEEIDAALKEITTVG
jgi:epoxyqueuosine reductase